jgi:hypothetical protein
MRIVIAMEGQNQGPKGGDTFKTRICKMAMSYSLVSFGLVAVLGTSNVFAEESIKDFAAEYKSARERDERNKLRGLVRETKQERDKAGKVDTDAIKEQAKKTVARLELERDGIARLSSDLSEMKSYLEKEKARSNEIITQLQKFKEKYEALKVETEKTVANEDEATKKARIEAAKTALIKEFPDATLSDDGKTVVLKGTKLKGETGRGLTVHPTFVIDGDNIKLEYRLGILDDHKPDSKTFTNNSNLGKLLDEERKAAHEALLKASRFDSGVSIAKIKLGQTGGDKAYIERILDKDQINGMKSSAQGGLDFRHKTELGTKTGSGKVAEENEKISDATRSKNETQKKLAIKIKVGEWLLANDGRELEPCDIVLRALGGNKAMVWKMLDEETQDECSELKPATQTTDAGAENPSDPKNIFERLKAQQEEESQKSQEKAQQEIAQQSARQARTQQELAFLQAFCESEKMSESAISAAEQITKPIEKLQDAIIQSGATSTTFAKVCSPISDMGFEEMTFDLGMLEDYSSKTAVLASEFSRSADGNRQLIAERDALNAAVRKSYAALEKAGALLEGAARLQGMIDPYKIHPEHADKANNEVNVRLTIAQQRMSKLATYHNCALQAANALQQEILGREEEMNMQLGGRGLSQRNAGGLRNPPVVGGQSAGSAARSGGARNSGIRRPPNSNSNRSPYLNN